MTQITVKVTGDKQLMRALDGDLRKATRRAGHLVGLEIRREVAEYPPQSEANFPRGFGSAFSIKTRKAANRWYERGYGPRWARKDGSAGGSKTSEMLNRSWMVGRNSWGAFVASLASYSPVVHHYKEQASFHKRRGWTTDKMAIENVIRAGKVDRIMRRVIKRLLKG